MCDIKGDHLISENSTEQTLKSRESIQEGSSSDPEKSKAEQIKEALTTEHVNYSSSDENVFLDSRNGDVINLQKETNNCVTTGGQKFVGGEGRGHFLSESMNILVLQSQLKKIHPVGLGNSVIESHFSKTTENETKTRKEDQAVCEKKIVEREANGNPSITREGRTASIRNVLLSSLLNRQGNFDTDS